MKLGITVADLGRMSNTARVLTEPSIDGFAAEREVIVGLLNHTLASTVVTYLRLRRHAAVTLASGGIAGYATTEDLERLCLEASTMATLLTAHIERLGGAPDFDPDGLIDRAHASYVAGRSLVEMLAEDFVAALVAVEVLGEMLRYIGDRDPVTRALLAAIGERERDRGAHLRHYLEKVGAIERRVERPS